MRKQKMTRLIRCARLFIEGLDGLNATTAYARTTFAIELQHMVLWFSADSGDVALQLQGAFTVSL